MESFLEDVNRHVSDRELVSFFCFFILRTVFNDIVTATVVRNALAGSDKSKLRVRHETIFSRHSSHGFMFLRFMECCIWLFRNNVGVALMDDKFQEYVDFVEKVQTTETDRPSEEHIKFIYQEILNINTYVRSGEASKLGLHLVTLSDVDKIAGSREGQNVWGPIYWGVIHRYVWRLESKVSEFCRRKCDHDGRSYRTYEEGEEEETRKWIGNCYSMLAWFFKVCDELMPCNVCCYHYRNNGFNRILYDMVNRSRCDALLRIELLGSSSRAAATTTTTEAERDKRKVVDSIVSYYSNFIDVRLLSIELFVLHHRHKESLNDFAHSNYNIEKLMADLKSAPVD